MKSQSPRSLLELADRWESTPAEDLELNLPNPLRYDAEGLQSLREQELEKRQRSVPYLRERSADLYAELCRPIPARFREAETDLTLSERGFFLFGPVGVGKTYTAAALARQAAWQGYELAWLSATAWLAAIRASFNGGPAAESVEGLVRADLLVLDDLGAERPTEWAREQLFAVVNAAYEEGHVLIVTSNLKPSDLRDRLGERIVSRLVEACDLVPMTGPDRRLQTAANRKDAS